MINRGPAQLGWSNLAIQYFTDLKEKRKKAAEGGLCKAYLIREKLPYECIIKKKAEANESISGVLMILESCVCMFSHKPCISAFPLTFLRSYLRRQRRRGCREAN